MFVSFEDFNSLYSQQGIISLQGSSIGKDYNPLNPNLDPCQYILQTSTGETHPIPVEATEKGIWSVESVDLHILQLQIGIESTYPRYVIALVTDETYTTLEGFEGIAGMQGQYNGEQ